MTDYTILSNTAVGVGGLPSGATVTALRDNPIAIAEGAVGAPSVLPNIASRSFIGGIGTYAAAQTTSGAAEGGLVSGANLRYTDFNGITLGSTPAGTWRNMGVALVSGSSRSSVFLRIS